jgi:hypothetical protein
MSKPTPSGAIDFEALLKAQADTLKDHGNEIGYMKGLLIAMVVVLFVGFAGLFVATGAMMVDALNNKSTSYSELRDAIFDQKLDIELLKQELQLRHDLSERPAATTPDLPKAPVR